MAEPVDSRRAELIAAAQTKWIAALTDMGGRNTLLYYKDRRASTLDLAAADPQALERFLKTGSARLTRLFRDADLRADAIRRVGTIYRKAKELAEERGINAGYLAIGMARWDELFLEPAAPVLLRGLTISPTRARHDDFDLTLDDESEVNPVLLHKLATVFGAEAGGLGGEPVTDPDSAYENVCAQLRRVAKDADVPGFDIVARKVIGTFTYAKLPMVRDLQNAGELLADSDIVAAIAGDPEAQTGLGSGADGQGADAGDADGPDADGHDRDGHDRDGHDRDGHDRDGRRPDELALDAVPPEDDYTVLDADSSQSSAINAVLRGGSLVVHGPPGTGKSQTIANLIATLVARGRKVLFVAEKRAAIDAVLSRLKGVGLGDIVLDIHDGTRDRLRIARDLGATLDRAQQISPPDVLNLHRRLVDRRRRLAQHADALHEVHRPWGVTAFQVQSALLGIPDAARTSVRLPDVERIDGETVDRIRDELREYAHLGGFVLRPDSTPWYGAAVHAPEQARQAYELATTLCTRTLPQAKDQLARAAAETGLYPPGAYAEWGERLRLYVAVQETRRKLDPQVYGARPDLLAAVTAPRDDRTAAPSQASRLSWSERRALVKRARSMWLLGKPERDELHQALAEAAAQLAAWMRLRADAEPPRVPSNLADALRGHAECEEQLAALRAFVQVPGDAEPMLSALRADRDTPWKLPRLYQLRAGFAELGLRPLVDELTARSAGPGLAVQALDHAWYSSLLDVIRVRDPRYAAYRGDALDEIAADFRDHDVEHLTANRARVRRAVADRLRDAQDDHPLQARVISKQAALRRRHMPLRRLLDQASDVLFALKPCWAMSPLVVSQVLPASRLFDVVIFDEASQIIPADAIPSIMRAHQVVVAGDGHQLPPTNFFRQVGDGDAGEEEADGDGGADDAIVSFGSGFESVLDTLRPLLPTWPLTWHYRSRDERLVAFSNARIYDGALTTFPGVFRDDCMRHVVVAQDRTPGQENSVTAEVDKVVELIIEHARTRPDESLGVIALGIKHAERIDEALRAALAEDPKPPPPETTEETDEEATEEAAEEAAARAAAERAAAERAAADRAALEEFFAEDRSEPFFVKNLERVQGDERDAIILSIGYGKHPDGRMRYHWGPLLRDGGERRLNVAATRAKHRLTLVSSFSVHDVDPERVTKPGARLLAEYLEYAGSGGAQLGSAATRANAELNLFQSNVRERLRGLGITVVPQFGVGGYRVDFAAAHPDEPGRMVLAIEADGPSYHASRSARDRDRLRKEHLERLGWVFHRIWSTNWFHDPESEVAKLQAAYERAVSTAAAEPPAPAGDEVPSRPNP